MSNQKFDSAREFDKQGWDEPEGDYVGIARNGPTVPKAGQPVAIDILRELVDWANYMGGFDAFVWRKAEQLLEEVDKESTHVPD